MAQGNMGDWNWEQFSLQVVPAGSCSAFHMKTPLPVHWDLCLGTFLLMDQSEQAAVEVEACSVHYAAQQWGNVTVYRGNSETFISCFTGMWNWQQWLFAWKFKTFCIILLPFVSSSHSFMSLFWFRFICLFEAKSCTPRSIQDLSFYSRAFWKWWAALESSRSWQQGCVPAAGHVLCLPQLICVSQ